MGEKVTALSITMTALNHGQWIGRSEADNGASVTSVVNIEKRSPDQAQLLGISPQFNIRGLSYATVKREPRKVTGEIGNFHVFDDTLGWIPLPQYWEKNKLPG